MSTDKKILVGFGILCLFVLVDIGLRVRQIGHAAKGFVLTKQFAVVPLHTNDSSGMMIADRIKDQPIWGKWGSEREGMVSFFIEGRLVLNVTYVEEGRAETEVLFYGKDGKLISHWKARESGQFFGRTVYGENGAKSEAWLAERWYPIEVRTDGGKPQEGVMLDGKWRRLLFTNGVPGVEW